MINIPKSVGGYTTPQKENPLSEDQQPEDKGTAIERNRKAVAAIEQNKIKIHLCRDFMIQVLGKEAQFTRGLLHAAQTVYETVRFGSPTMEIRLESKELLAELVLGWLREAKTDTLEQAVDLWHKNDYEEPNEQEQP